jgi:hypothetical protein
MDFIIYPLLNLRSKKALRRIKTRFGHTARYQPRPQLIERLKEETGMTEEQILRQIRKEQEYIRTYRRYF